MTHALMIPYLSVELTKVCFGNLLQKDDLISYPDCDLDLEVGTYFLCPICFTSSFCEVSLNLLQ